MDPIIKAGQWETTIGGVRFLSRRKCTAVMLKAHGFIPVAGQLEAQEPSDQQTPEARRRSHAEFVEAVMRAALIEPVLAPPGEPTIAGEQYAYSDLEPFADAWVVEFMRSGIDPNPIVPSCAGSEAPRSQEG